MLSAACGAQMAVPRVGDARPDWQIVRALSEVAGVPLPYDTEEGARERLSHLAPHLKFLDKTEPPLWLNGEYFKVRSWAEGGSSGRGVPCPALPGWLKGCAAVVLPGLRWLHGLEHTSWR